jgi:hypothetical protein
MFGICRIQGLFPKWDYTIIVMSVNGWFLWGSDKFVSYDLMKMFN